MIGKGVFLKTRTKTLNDVFGEVIWEVAETGLKAPEEERKGAMDGVKCVMIGGTGSAARAGFVVIDSEYRIGLDVSAGITVVISPEQKDEILGEYGRK